MKRKRRKGWLEWYEERRRFWEGDEDDHYDPFRYAPGPPFRRGYHPGFLKKIWRYFRGK